MIFTSICFCNSSGQIICEKKIVNGFLVPVEIQNVCVQVSFIIMRMCVLLLATMK